jgi:NAD(P)-dependent dehydrogenase (short-subunit alcohol dehydrogenase family)
LLEGGHGGAIVNVGSVNSFLGSPCGSAYVASKPIVFLCLDEASSITGTTLTPDGGFVSTF